MKRRMHQWTVTHQESDSLQSCARPMLEEKETRLQTMDITFSSRFTDQQMHKKVREDTAQDLQEREMKVCKEGFIIKNRDLPRYRI